MKAVPQQCGALGRVRPALRLCRGAHGPTRPPLPVRALPRAGHPVQPLRPRQPLLRTAMPAAGTRRGTAPGCAPLPEVQARPRLPCAALTSLAPAPRRARGRLQRRGGRTQRDAPGFPAGGGVGSTAGMDTRHHHRRRCRHGRRHHSAEPIAGTRSCCHARHGQHLLGLLPLRRPAARGAASGLRAPRRAGTAAP